MEETTKQEQFHDDQIIIPPMPETETKRKMRGTEKNKDHKYIELDKVLDRYRGEKGELIRVLHSAQKIFGYLPQEVQAYVALKMDIPVSEVNGVVTFYTLFVTEPKGKHTVNVCMGTACYVKGANEIMDKLKEELKLDAQETSTDGLFTVRSSRCIGACGMAPVMTVDEEVHGKLNPADLTGILKKYQEQDAGEEHEHDQVN